MDKAMLEALQKKLMDLKAARGTANEGEEASELMDPTAPDSDNDDAADDSDLAPSRDDAAKGDAKATDPVSMALQKHLDQAALAGKNDGKSGPPPVAPGAPAVSGEDAGALAPDSHQALLEAILGKGDGDAAPRGPAGKGIGARAKAKMQSKLASYRK